MTIIIESADVTTLPLSVFDGVDVLITDPPYSRHVHENMASHGTGGRGSRPRDPGFSYLTPEVRIHVAERIIPRVRRWSVVFSDLQSAHLWDKAVTRDGLGQFEAVRWVPWIRWSQPQLSGDRPPSGAEMVVHYHAPRAKRWNGPGSLTHYARRCLRGADKHPTEKPLDLMLDLVSWYSDPGEAVADVFAGVGTTALACQLLGRDCVSFELDPQWTPRARDRQAFAEQRDRERATEWVTTTIAEAQGVPEPKAADGSDVKTWERAQRRIADAYRVAALL